MRLKVVEVAESDLQVWDDYVHRRNDSTFTDTSAWRKIIKDVYNIEQYWFLVKSENDVLGCMALTLANSTIFGRYLATAPFGSYGGFYYETEEAYVLLIKKAEELKVSLHADYVLIRKYDLGESFPDGWVKDSIYSSFMIKIQDSPEVYRKKIIGRRTRACIKKCENNGFHTVYGHQELLNDFWQVVVKAMKDLGSPYHSYHYLETILNTFGSKVIINIIYSKEHIPCAAGLGIKHNDQVDWLYGPKLDQYRSFNIGELLYWSFIRKTYDEGFRIVNLGRSVKGSGNDHFKQKWRPIRDELAYWYFIPEEKDIPRVNQFNRKYRLAISMWRRTPIWLQNKIGPKIISGIL